MSFLAALKSNNYLELNEYHPLDDFISFFPCLSGFSYGINITLNSVILQVDKGKVQLLRGYRPMGY
jgi:hypothetical protein